MSAPTPARSATRYSLRSARSITAFIANRKKARRPDDRVSGIGRRGFSRFSGGDRATRPIRADGPRRGIQPTVLPAADPAPDRLYGVLLAARGRPHRDLHRHGA